ncbi:MAG: right-handed parallel beta-helix repeat-containing protein [Geminicoccaceae bacterium]
MTIFTVTTTADVVAADGKLSLREAVNQANATTAADQIVFASGLEGKTLTLTGGELVLGRDVTIDGDRNDDGLQVTIDGNGNGRIFNITGTGTDVALRDLGLTGGYAGINGAGTPDGGAILLGGGSLVVTGSTITGNSAYFAVGGGIFADDGSRVTIVGSSVTANHASYGTAGGIAGGSDVTLTIRDSEISGNKANYGGIGIDLGPGGSLTVEDSRISGNFADEGGGRGLSVDGSATIARTTISGNYGGGIFARQLILTDSTVADNNVGIYGGSGAGILAGDLIIRNSTVTGNRAAGDGPDFIARGAGILADHIDIANSIVAGNTLGEYSTGSPDIAGTIVFSNGHNVFGSDVDGNVSGDRENIAASALFAALDPLTGGGLLGVNGIVQLLNDVTNPAVSAADPLAASATGQLGAARPLPAGSLADLGSAEVGQPLSPTASLDNDVLFGTSHADTIKGLAGADWIQGLAGDDTLRGGNGGDLLDGGKGNDDIFGDAGIDLVYYGGSTKVTVDLGLGKATRGGETDKLHTLEGAIGSSVGDVLKGDGDDNWFQGGLGKDSLTGRGGRDLYDYDGTAESRPGARDVIKDFAHLTDKLDLMGIDADTTVAGNQTFHWVGTDPLSGPGEVGFFTSGGNTIVRASTDADGASELEIQLTGIKTLTATDFYL